MSLFGALDTAVSGLGAQSDAITNISDNVANSQTVGYKRFGTNFADYLTVSTPTLNGPDSVVAMPAYRNDVQGTITQSSNPLAMAIDGAGFFAVTQATGTTNSGTPTFSTQTSYTRAGDFSMNKDGYLVNSAGNYLEAYPVSPTGTVNQTALVPVQISQTQYAPIPTSDVSLAANLPQGTTTATTPMPGMTSQIDIYDQTGGSHTLSLSWAPPATTTGAWTLSAAVDGGAATSLGSVTFNANGAIKSVTPTTTGVTDNTAGSPATVSFTPTYSGATGTPIALNLGTIGQSGGITSFAGSYALNNISQNGVPPGAFTGVSDNTSGQIIANYSNGQSVTIAQVPLVTFHDPNALQSQNGQTYAATSGAGPAMIDSPNNNGAGGLVTGSVENSNVDIASEFTKLIVAQQAYGANAKTVTTVQQMMQTALNMVQ